MAKRKAEPVIPRRLREKVNEQQEIAAKLSKTIVRVNPTRITVYTYERVKKGVPPVRKYANKWIPRNKYDNLLRNSKEMIKIRDTYRNMPLPEGFKKPSLVGMKTEIPVWLKTGKMKKSVKRVFRVITYTDQQNAMVQKLLKERKIPVTKRPRHSLQKLIANLAKPFRLMGIRYFVTRT